MHKKKKVGSALTTLLVTLILGVILVIMFWKVLNRERPLGESEASEVKILLEKDIENDYPVTPREVIKLYLRFISCFYGEELERDEIEGLVEQQRKLYDDELLEINPVDISLSELKKEIDEYRENKRVIDSYKIQKGSAIEYYNKGQSEYAKISVQITTRDEDTRYYTNEEFVLRKDAKGHYKILGWQVIDELDLDDH